MLNYIMFYIYIIKLNIIHFGFLLPILIPIYLQLLNIIYFIRVNLYSISVKLIH